LVSQVMPGHPRGLANELQFLPRLSLGLWCVKELMGLAHRAPFLALDSETLAHSRVSSLMGLVRLDLQ